MVRHVIGGVLAIALWSGVVHAQCEGSAPVREIMFRAQYQDQIGLPRTDQLAKQAATLEEGLKKYPDDYFLLRHLMITKMQKDEQVARDWAAAFYKQNPNQPINQLFYAKSLLGKNTPEAIRQLEALKAAHPEAAQVYLELVSIFSYGKFKDKDRMEQELAGYLKICPATKSANGLYTVLRNGTHEQIVQTASAVRKRVEGESDPFLSDLWKQLWAMEFKAYPPSEHAALRKRIVEDLGRFGKVPAWYQLPWLDFLESAYESAGEPEKVKEVDSQIARDFPASNEAKGIARQAWRKEHPYPEGADDVRKEAYSRASLAANREWHAKWPDDSSILFGEFSALTDLPDTTAKQIEAVADELLHAYQKNPNWFRFPPMEFKVAAAYLKYKTRIDRVPKLVAQGDESAKKWVVNEPDDRAIDEASQMQVESLDDIHLEKARLLLDFYASTKQQGKVREVEADLDSIHPEKPVLKSALLARRAQAAEVEGRNLDAMMLYRNAMVTRGRGPGGGEKDELAENLERLWKELGGTLATYALLLEKSKATEATDSHWERPKNPLPAFVLTDLNGKTWKLTEMQGKMVLVNVWATWCGPCRQEHPEFQKLYDKLKDRTDVTVLSFNVDDDLSKVEPYIRANKYTFPVLLGHDLVDEVVPLLAIPRNWFIDANGKLQWEQVGYGADQNWQDMMLARLAEVLKQTP